MRCTSCGEQNPEGMRFCGGCGERLAVGCVSCGQEVPAGMRFCGACGKPLSTAPVSRSAPPAAASAASRPSTAPATRMAHPGEWREFTIMFCDLVGSTELSEKLDAEDLQEIVHRYQHEAKCQIDLYEGYVAQYLGDGILVYFGYPAAHEDDPQRAILTGLAILDRVRHLSQITAAEFGVSVQVRLGIHTGAGVMGDVGAAEGAQTLMIGATPNIAARIQGLADPNEIYVSDVTKQLAEGWFEFRDCGSPKLKGVNAPLRVWNVVNARTAVRRFQRVAPGGRIEFVGRTAELERLRQRLAAAESGTSQVVVIRAEAGMGKSRLLHAFLGEVTERVRVFEANCNPFAKNTVFFPLIGLVQELFGLSPQDDVPTLQRKLVDAVTEGPLGERWAVPILARLLSLDVPEGFQPLDLTPQMAKLVTVQLLSDLLLQYSRSEPVVFVLEDIHWVDPSTLELLSLFVNNPPEARIVVIATARPEFEVPWQPRPHLEVVSLERLEDAQVEVLIDSLAGARPLSRALRYLICSKTDGIPLYVEEVTKALLESGKLNQNGEIASGELAKIPTTLAGSLTARLDRLGAAARTAQIASAIGRDFSHALLQAVSGLDRGELREHVHLLENSDLVLRMSQRGNVAYVFKHALIRDAAYGMLLKPDKKTLHLAVARTLEDLFPDTVEAQPELLAHHWLGAAETRKGIDYLLRAGQAASVRSAHAEANKHFDSGIAALDALPQGPERSRLELSLRLPKSVGLIATMGYCAEPVHSNYQRAHALCKDLDNPPQLTSALYGLWVVHLARSERASNADYAEQLLAWANQSADPVRTVVCQCAYGITQFYNGRLTQAEEKFRSVLELYEPSMHALLVGTIGDDSGVFATAYLAWQQALTGHLESAKRLAAQSTKLANGLDDPLMLALSLTFEMIVAQAARDAERTLELANEVGALAARQGFPFWGATAKIGRGFARAQLGDTDGVIEEIESGIAFFDLIAQKLPYPYWCSYLVDTWLHLGKPEKADAVLDQLIPMAETNVDSFYLPELQRYRGDVLVVTGRKDEAVKWYERAIQGAHAQGAQLLALRAQTALTRAVPSRRGELEARLAEFGEPCADRTAGQALLQ